MISYEDQRCYAHTSRKDVDPHMQLLESREITPDCKIGNKISFWFLAFSGIMHWFLPAEHLHFIGESEFKFILETCKCQRTLQRQKEIFLCPSAGFYQCGTRQQRPGVIWDMFYASSPSFQDWQIKPSSETILLLKELLTAGESQLLRTVFNSKCRSSSYCQIK